MVAILLLLNYERRTYVLHRASPKLPLRFKVTLINVIGCVGQGQMQIKCKKKLKSDKGNLLVNILNLYVYFAHKENEAFIL